MHTSNVSVPRGDAGGQEEALRGQRGLVTGRKASPGWAGGSSSTRTRGWRRACAGTQGQLPTSSGTCDQGSLLYLRPLQLYVHTFLFVATVDKLFLSFQQVIV